MRAFYIPLGLLAVILGFSLWTGRYVELRTEHWIALLEETEESARQVAVVKTAISQYNAERKVQPNRI